MDEKQFMNSDITPQPMPSQDIRQKATLIKESLPEGHMIRTMIEEHEKILEFLSELGLVNEAIQKMDSLYMSHPQLERLRFLAESLVGAEPHHQREEEVLFPQIETLGPMGPPRAMRMEHTELRKYKKKLRDLYFNAEKMDFESFKKELDKAVNFIVPTLSGHIAKEDTVLYPFALRLISDKGTWDSLKEESDRIGYCSFTPRH